MTEGGDVGAILRPVPTEVRPPDTGLIAKFLSS
jgi:hypothetical protein